MKYVDRHGCGGKCSRIYFVCVSGLDFDEQRSGTATYEGLLEYVCVFLCLYPSTYGLSKQCRRIWVALNYSLRGGGQAGRGHVGWL